MEQIWNTFLSRNGNDQIHYCIWKEDMPARGVVQIAHGMGEHMECTCYKELAAFLCSHGYIVCGNDHIGHGRSAPGPEDLGYFGDKIGWIHMIDDMHQLTNIMKEQYDDLPYFLLGHSMGSLLSRGYMSVYGDELDGTVIMGTSGRNSKADFLYIPMKAAMAVKGERYRSETLYKVLFGHNNRGFKKKKESEYAWMTENEEAIREYIEDPNRNFIFTLRGFEDLYRLLKFVSRKEWGKDVPRQLPVYLMSGGKDPVGENGKGVYEVHRALRRAGVKDVSLKLYPKARHELLNEYNRDQVCDDILKWLDKHVRQDAIII